MNVKAEIAAKQLGDRNQRVLLELHLAREGVPHYDERRTSLDIKRITKANLNLLHVRDMINYYPHTHLTKFGKEVVAVIEAQRAKAKEA